MEGSSPEVMYPTWGALTLWGFLKAEWKQNVLNPPQRSGRWLLSCTESPVSMAVWLDGWEAEKHCAPLGAKGAGPRIWGPSMLLSPPPLAGCYLHFS